MKALFIGGTGTISTDAVSYTHLPVNYYGYTKWKGEERVAETCSSYAIVRVEIVYGKALPGQHGNIVQLSLIHIWHFF